MNILILNWRDPKNPQAGGAEIVTLEHAKAWTKAGHAVTWFSSRFPGSERFDSVDGIRIIRFGSAAFGVQICAFFWYTFGIERFDLVVDQIHGLPFFTPLYVRAKKLVFIHEVAKEVWHLNPWPWPFNVLAAVIGANLEPWIFTFFYRSVPFMTVSQSTQKDLMDWGIPENNITVIHNGIHIPEKLRKVPKEAKNTALYLGAIAVDKGIHDVIHAFSEIHSRDINWQFWIVGHGSKKEIDRLQQLAKSLGIDKKIVFWGYVSEEKKYELLEKAHVLLHPSVREGWGLVVIEAASQRTPSVVYDVPGLRDSVVDGVTGIVLKKNSPSEMAEVVIALLKDKKRYAALQQGSQKWAESLTWEKAVKKSIKLIKSLYDASS